MDRDEVDVGVGCGCEEKGKRETQKNVFGGPPGMCSLFERHSPDGAAV